ncbi:MAG: hypothetical protein J1E41_04155 [Ruminococcus sp.]|nr:hypothetical protein [Ruminococcus sp.]
MKKFTKILSCVLAIAVMCSSYAMTSVSAATVSKPKIKVSNTAKGIKISWKKAKGAKRYVVMRKLSSAKSYKKLKTVKLSSYIDKKAKAGKKYSYQVKAVNGSANATSKAKTIVRLKAPTSVKVKLVNEFAGFDDEDAYYVPKVSWKKVKGAKKYEVYRAKFTGKSAGAYKKQTTLSSASYYDYGAMSGSNYKYKIKAVNGSSKSVYSAASAKCGFMDSPYIHTKINSAYDGIEISWYGCTGATGYKLYKSTDKGKTFSLLKDSKSFKKAKDEYGEYEFLYEDKNVTSGKVYVYYAVAYNSTLTSNKAGGNKSRIMFNDYDVILEVGDTKTNTELSQEYTMMKLFGSDSTEILLTSDDESIAKVNVREDSTGSYTVTITGVSAGETYINFKVIYSGVEVSSEKIKVKVSADPVYDITLKKGETDIIYQLDSIFDSFTFYDDDELIVTVTSGNTSVVKVNNPNSKNFTITGVAPGEAMVNVKVAIKNGVVPQEVVNEGFTVLVTE